MAQYLGAGVAACYRGYRLYDTDRTKDLVKKYVLFYKVRKEEGAIGRQIRGGATGLTPRSSIHYSVNSDISDANSFTSPLQVRNTYRAIQGNVT